MTEIEHKAIAKRDLETHQKTVHSYLTETEKDRRTLLVEVDRLRRMLRNETESAKHLLDILKGLANAAETVVVRKSLDAQPAVVRSRSDDQRVRVVRGPVSLPSGRAEVVVEADVSTHFSVGDWYDEWEILEIARSGNNERRLRLMLRCAKCNARCTCGRVDELARKET